MSPRSAIVVIDLLKGFFKSNPTLPDPLDAKRLFATVRRVIDAGRERGITIKASAVSVSYTHPDTGQKYMFNLIDTPGHVDFSYEVSRSLAACEGAVLVVDATQGVEAQTLANSYLAIANSLDILSVINKVDLPSAEPERVREQIENVIGLDAHDAVLASAKSGIGVDEILEKIVTKISAPTGDADGPLRALLFDSWYDSYRGVVSLVRIVDGDHEMVESGGVDGVGVGSVDQLEGDELVVGQLQHRQRAEPALRHPADHLRPHRPRPSWG